MNPRLRRVPERGAIVVIATAAVLVALTACVPTPSVGTGPSTTGSEGGPDLSAPTSEYVTITDPVEDSFTVDVPKGWSSVAYASGELDVHREVVTTISPDGRTVLFLGDPKLPSYWLPEAANETVVSFAEALDFVEIQPYTPAPDYFALWTEVKFQGLEDFEFVSVEPNYQLAQNIQQQFADAGMQPPQVDAVEVRFDYTADGVPIHAYVVGITSNNGYTWNADVSGLSTDRAIDDYAPMLVAMSQSKQTNPAFVARQQALHEQTMAQIQANTDAMTQQHYANMAAIQASAVRHQDRMEAIWASNDASIQSYNDRMATGDAIQEGFVNYINDESTVLAPSGQTYQVDNGYQTYYVNKYDQSYVAGDDAFGDSQIRELGLNPSDYEQVQVIR